MSVRLYRKKPIVIEAVRYADDRSNVAEALAFLIKGKIHHMVKSAGILIRTMEGDMLAEPGDYIIRGIKGEFYPCKPDIFEATYESLGNDNV